jgi:o-succinylbenzoate synthase
VEWIEIANSLNIGWWITSALESNVGLNAICQFTSNYTLDLFQGLGTGAIYENNIDSPLRVEKGNIFLDHSLHWNMSNFSGH